MGLLVPDTDLTISTPFYFCWGGVENQSLEIEGRKIFLPVGFWSQTASGQILVLSHTSCVILSLSFGQVNFLMWKLGKSFLLRSLWRLNLIMHISVPWGRTRACVWVSVCKLNLLSNSLLVSEATPPSLLQTLSDNCFYLLPAWGIVSFFRPHYA